MAEPSEAARAAAQQVELLAQRLGVVERFNEKQQQQIEHLTKEASGLQGEMKGAKEANKESKSSVNQYITWGMPFVMLAVGGAIYGQINDIKRTQIEEGKSSAAVLVRLKALEDKPSVSLSDVNARLAQFDTKISTLETGIQIRDANSSRRDTLLGETQSSIAANDAKTASASQAISSNSDKISALQKMASEMQRDISSMSSRSSAQAVEFESQMRGVMATLQVKFDQIDGMIALTYEKSFGVKPADTKPFPNNIPAQAFTEIGGGTSSGQ